MTPATVERLKADWTGRRVTVADGTPTLRRFAGQNGTVVTVNMNGQALVRFDYAADIGWYDIAISDLVPVQEPAPRCDTTPRSEHARSAPDPAPVVKHDPAVPAGSTEKLTTKMILELARKQGSAKKS